MWERVMLRKGTRRARALEVWVSHGHNYVAA